MLARGTTTAVCDPHEIANVLGAAGVRYFLDAAASLLTRREPLKLEPVDCAAVLQTIRSEVTGEARLKGVAIDWSESVALARTVADGEKVDASASLPDGTKFQGIAGLRNLLVSHKEDYVRTLTEKLLAYSIGRGIEYYDMPAIRQIARESAPADYRWSSLVVGIVRSKPFSMGIVKENSQ